MKEEDYQNDIHHTETDVKQYIEEFTVDDSSKISKTNLETETESQEVSSNIYHCSYCDINFPSIEDHINNCHKDQEVVFQVILKKKFIYVYKHIYIIDCVCR